jgi:NhaA family Na+:H+ antiporter
VAPAIRVFLLALAVVDDLGAVIVIAVFYTSQIHWLALVSALAYFAAAYVFRNSKWIFALFAVATWWFVHQSGVHATIAGCALGFIAPDPRRLATRLHPYTAFIVMPLFAFANAGLDLSGAWHFNPIEIAIVVALLIGKPLGILSASWTALHFKFAHAEFRFRDLAGVACLGGIGFTMSIFVARLAFAGDALEVAKLGVVKGSLLSALLGSSLLMMTKRMRRSEEHRSSP